jgi:hypothetical protein
VVRHDDDDDAASAKLPLTVSVSREPASSTHHAVSYGLKLAPTVTWKVEICRLRHLRHTPLYIAQPSAASFELAISTALPNRSVPPQSMAPVRTENTYFEDRCPHGLPCLLKEVHHLLWLLQYHPQAPITLNLHIFTVLSNRSVPPQSMAPLSSERAYFEDRYPDGLSCLLGEAHHH